MSLKPTTKCREYREGMISRRHTYKCRVCGMKFQVDTVEPLKVKERKCPECTRVCKPGDHPPMSVCETCKKQCPLGGPDGQA